MNKIAGLFLSTLTICSQALSQDYYGTLNLENQKIDASTISGGANLKQVEGSTLNVSGSLEFEYLTLTDSLTVSGSLIGSHLQCKDLKVSGAVDVKHMKVSGPLTVSGALLGRHIHVDGNTTVSGAVKVHKSTFNNLIISSHESHLHDSTANRISVLKPDDDKIQIVYLHGETTISGDIVFESGNGEVRAEKTVVIKGTIKGGTLVQI